MAPPKVKFRGAVLRHKRRAILLSNGETSGWVNVNKIEETLDEDLSGINDVELHIEEWYLFYRGLL